MWHHIFGDARRDRFRFSLYLKFMANINHRTDAIMRVNTGNRRECVQIFHTTR